MKKHKTNNENTLLNQAGYILYYWLQSYVVIILFCVAFLLLLNVLGIPSHTDEVTTILHGSNESKSWLFFGSTLLLAPIFEELAFRHPLKDFQKNFRLGISAILILIFFSIFTNSIAGFLLVIMGVVFTGNLYVLKHKLIKPNVSAQIIYLISMSFFVVAHFGTLEILRPVYWPIYVLYAAHMGISAYFLSKLRMEHTTSHSMILHFLYNLLPALILLF